MARDGRGRQEGREDDPVKNRRQPASAAPVRHSVPSSRREGTERPFAESPSATEQDPGGGLWSLAAVAQVAIAVVAIVWFLSWARPIIVPVLGAFLIGMIVGPIADRTRRFGIPTIVTNTIVLIVLGLAAYGVGALFVPTLAEWIARVPEQISQIREKVAFIQNVIERIQEFEKLVGGGQPVVQVDQSPGVTSVLAAVSPAFAELFVFVFTLIFFMLGRNELKQRAVLALEGRERRLTALRIVADVERSLLDYFAVISVINAGVALATALALFLLGMPNAPVWGFLAFAFNFLPVIGPLVLKVLLLATGLLIMPTLTWAVLPALSYLVITATESNLITPRVIGKRITVNPLLIFVTICFLTWLWGPIGALLSMPIVSVTMIVAQHLRPTEEVSLPG